MEYVYDVSLWASLLHEHGYELLGQLDSGSFSEVFAVKSHTNHRILAVKRMVARREISLDPRIVKEITCLKQLSMRGCCVISLEGTIWKLDRLACLVLELAPLGDLERYGMEHWPLSAKLVNSTVRQVLSALTHCHRLQIAHRDVNPANVLLMTERSVRLADFGLAFHCRDTTGRRVLCEDYLGRESYLSPEALLCQPYDALQADMWSFGCLCLFLLTGKHPLPRGSCPDTSDARASSENHLSPAMIPGLCKPLNNLVKGIKHSRQFNSHGSEGSCRSESDFEDTALLSLDADTESDCLSSGPCFGDDCGFWSEEEVFKQPTATDFAVVHLVSKLRVNEPSERLKAEEALKFWKSISSSPF